MDVIVISMIVLKNTQLEETVKKVGCGKWIDIYNFWKNYKKVWRLDLSQNAWNEEAACVDRAMGRSGSSHVCWGFGYTLPITPSLQPLLGKEHTREERGIKESSMKN